MMPHPERHTEKMLMDAKMAILSLKDYLRQVKLLNREENLSHIIIMDNQHFTDVIKTNRGSQSKIITKSRIFFLSFLIITLTVLFITNSFFTSRFSDIIKSQAQLNLTKNTNNVLSELQKNSIIPQLLVNDQEITKALISRRFFSFIRKIFSFYK